jgi:hypothetical protein
MKYTFNRFLLRLSEQGCRAGKKTKQLFVITFLIVSGMSLSAQNFIGFDSTGFTNMPDTIGSGSFVNVTVNVQNLSMMTFSDSIGIAGYIDTSQAHNVLPIPAFWTVATMPPNDTMLFNIPLIFNVGSGGNGFRIGNNVIVVWPILTDPNFQVDSLTATVIILDGTSTGPDAEAGEIRCYPVPASSGPLYITNTNRSYVVKEITIRDASGKIVSVSDNPSTGILTESWASGVYMVEITFENGQHSYCKIIK